MKILVKPHVCLGQMWVDDREYAVWRDSLNFVHPNPNPQQAMNPYWDGKVNLFLDANKQMFPTGLFPHVMNFLTSRGVFPQVEYLAPIEKRLVKIDPNICDGITLREYQVKAIEAALAAGRGLITAPPRSGKTLMQAALAKTLGLPSVIFVEKQGLLDQHVENLRKWGLDPGIMQGSTRQTDKLHTVAMLQTVWQNLSKKEVSEWLTRIKVLQCDECHHGSSGETYYRTLLHCPAPWRFGYSGTPFSIMDVETNKFNEDSWRLVGAFGRPIYNVTTEKLRELGLMVGVDIIQIRRTEPDIREIDGNDWHKVYRAGVVECISRNSMVVSVAKKLVAKEYRPLVLVKMVEHGNTLFDMMQAEGLAPIFAKGGKTIRECTGSSSTWGSGSIGDAYQKIKAGHGNILIATQIADEGVDFPSVDSLILVVGGKGDQVTTQRIFRPLTSVQGKSKAIVIDFDDQTHGVLKKQSGMRRRLYKVLGFDPRVVSLNNALGEID
ncbi:MAG: hypothetical protein E6R03_09100 [Hyphomicrobiaceae bacterium]|nr:MAG: hypothetical protein E6R03_09100 [Hyphomicrobiaceae bacterium]